jgi:putative SOS response-associated peptidase YedK
VCGRFALFASMEEMSQQFGLKESVCMVARYNLSPQQMIPVILPGGRLQFMVWGFKPAWAGPDAFKPLINARVETLAERPAFRNSLRTQRCIIPASGYYEWQKIQDIKQPFYIHAPDNHLLAFAGIWSYQNEGAASVHTVAIVTTVALPSLYQIHDRMPLILTGEQRAVWLNGKKNVSEVLSDCQQTNMSFSAYPVTRQINSPHYEDQMSTIPLSN